MSGNNRIKQTPHSQPVSAEQCQRQNQKPRQIENITKYSHYTITFFTLTALNLTTKTITGGLQKVTFITSSNVD